MSDSECEIEYLDEDAEIVQQCVQSAPAQPAFSQPTYASEQRLLVERSSDRKRKRKAYDEDDSDYIPSEDEDAIKRGRKKNTSIKKPPKSTTSSASNNSNTLKTRVYTPVRYPKRTVNKMTVAPLNDYRIRKKMDIRIPDYDDPLCLPVRAMKRTGSDLQRLRNWNNVCLEHFKHCNNMLRPEKGETKGSSRSIVLRNVVHKETGKQELAIWSKTCVENNEGVRKSEIFQSILPKYRERKVLNPYNLQWGRRESKFHHVSEVILCKEEQKDEETLVVYKPKEKLSAVYKYVKDPKKVENPNDEDEPKKVLKETVCCKVCAPCFQTSWRGCRRNNNKNVVCPICRRPSVSVYNLLTHLKAHDAAAVRKHRRAIAVALAEVVDYHYRCRVCLEQFLSIKSLRQHVVSHKGTEMFKCEVGNHMAR